MAFNFGITPALTFDDLSALLVGETIELCGAFYNFTSYTMNISADSLNDFVVDLSVGDVTTSSVGLANSGTGLVQDSNIVVSANMANAMIAMAKGSAKATIAYALTGHPLGDIGELENDTTFDSLVTGADIAGVLASAIQDGSNAIISVAEDIIRDAALNSISDTGRDPNAPFESGDTLDFNMFVTNGNITLVVDKAANLTETGTGDAVGVQFFVDPTQSLSAGTVTPQVNLGTSGGQSSTSTGYFALGDSNNSYTTAANRYSAVSNLVSGYNSGEYNGSYLVGTKKGVLIRMRLTLN